MARARTSAEADETQTFEGLPEAPDDSGEATTQTEPDTNGDTGEETSSNGRAKVAKEMRPLFAEISRLSQTLAIARTACYTGEVGRATRALARLGRMVPDAVELAEMLTPTPEQ